MDLNTIKKRLAENYYGHHSECQKDIDLIFYNCRLYNALGSPVYLRGEKLNQLYQSLVAHMPKDTGALSLAKAEELTDSIAPPPSARNNRKRKSLSHSERSPHLPVASQPSFGSSDEQPSKRIVEEVAASHLHSASQCSAPEPVVAIPLDARDIPPGRTVSRVIAARRANNNSDPPLVEYLVHLQGGPDW